MANVVYEGDNVLKYELDGPSDPLGSNENDRFCKSVNGEAPDEVELWERNDPGPPYTKDGVSCCPGPIMTSANKPMKVKGQMEVEGYVGNPVEIFNPEFAINSLKPVVATPKPVDSAQQYDTSPFEDQASFWMGDPDGVNIPMSLHAIPSPGNPIEEIMVLGARRKRRYGDLIPPDVYDAGQY